MDIDELQTRAENLQKPRVGDILKLTRFLVKYLPTGISTTSKDPTKVGMEALSQVIGRAKEQDLVELGKILLMDDSLQLTEDDLDLLWMTEAFAVWAEKVDIKGIVKNAQRVAAAMRV